MSQIKQKICQPGAATANWLMLKVQQARKETGAGGQ